MRILPQETFSINICDSVCVCVCVRRGNVKKQSAHTLPRPHSHHIPSHVYELFFSDRKRGDVIIIIIFRVSVCVCVRVVCALSFKIARTTILLFMNTNVCVVNLLKVHFKNQRDILNINNKFIKVEKTFYDALTHILCLLLLLFVCADTTTHINRDVVDAALSPKCKRQRSSQDMFNQTDDSTSRNYQSQPMPQMLYHGDEAPAIDPHCEARSGFCFSQPAMLDDLILCTQLNSTQSSASQNLFQKLVRRMTRFFVSTNFDDSIKRLTATIEKLSYTWRLHDGGMVSTAHMANDTIDFSHLVVFFSQITISTIDRRKLQLVFKANVVEMDGKILLDFRLSKGCGLEFKRRFIKIKTLLSDVVVKGPVTWPIAIATQSMP